MFEVVVDPHALKQRGTSPASGPIHVRIGRSAFPDEQWSDFPCVILGWWLQLVRGGESGEFMFMEGPHALRVVRIAGERYELGFDQDSKAHICEVTSEDLLEALSSAAEALVDGCRLYGFQSSGLDLLLNR